MCGLGREGIPDYFLVVKHPMDLGTIGNKLRRGVYLTSDEFAADARLVLSNCRLYNKVDPRSKERAPCCWAWVYPVWACTVWACPVWASTMFVLGLGMAAPTAHAFVSRVYKVCVCVFPCTVLQDANNDVRRMGDHLQRVFESKYSDFLRQLEEERVRAF